MTCEKKEEHTPNISILSDNLLYLLKINLIIPFGGSVENLNKNEKNLTQIKLLKIIKMFKIRIIYKQIP